jgi:Zn-dependent peptidase ImmA (M78 family)/plasmid maintenance system antidote protein VapI
MAPSFRYEPDYAVAPGDSLRDTLGERGMTQADLAARTGLSLKHINQIAQGLAPITAETSLLFEKTTNVPARTWNSLESLYRERLARQDNREDLARDVEWLEHLPLKELIRRGRVTAGADKTKQVEEVCRFFGVADRERWQKLWLTPLVSFRQSTAFAADSGSVAAWLRLGELEASLIDTAPFDARAFKDALAEIRALTIKDPRRALKQLTAICARAGVAVVFLTDIGKTRASGAARWLTPTKALILLSDRYKSDDHFWFSFFHEAGHLLLHSKKETFISKDEKQAKKAALDQQEEQEANAFARNQLIPRRYESQLPLLHTDADVEEFADELGVAPGIVVGRLHNDGYWDWSKGNRLRETIDFGHLLK